MKHRHPPACCFPCSCQVDCLRSLEANSTVMWLFASEKLILWAEVWVGKGVEEKRQSICLIQRRSSIGWWGGEGNPAFTSERVKPPSCEVQPWENVSLHQSESLSTSGLIFFFSVSTSFAFQSGGGGCPLLPLCPLRTLWSPQSPCSNLYTLQETVWGLALPRCLPWLLCPVWWFLGHPKSFKEAWESKSVNI